MNYYFKPDFDPDMGDIFWIVPKEHWDKSKHVHFIGEVAGLPDGFFKEKKKLYYTFPGRKELGIKVLQDEGFIYNKEMS